MLPTSGRTRVRNDLTGYKTPDDKDSKELTHKTSYSTVGRDKKARSARLIETRNVSQTMGKEREMRIAKLVLGTQRVFNGSTPKRSEMIQG